MPVSYYANSPNQLCYLTPAPFVSIDKSYDKAGNGEILGVRYTITLTGTLVADRGSPTTYGADDFLAHPGDSVDPDHVHADSYNDILKKQQLMRKLFSKINEGGELTIQAPLPVGGGSEIRCWPRIESISFPESTAGNPFIQAYTVVLEADQLHGAGQTDQDDFISNSVNIKGQYISDASETWDISESDGKTVKRGSGQAIQQSERTYTLSHTMTAVGKRRFDVGTALADGIDRSERADRGANFWNKLEKTGTSEPKGEAWWQAREFVRKQLKHGPHFQPGRDESHNTGDDKDLYGINLPPYSGDTAYGAFNYVKVENVDELSGSFSVTETWVLAPKVRQATETTDISISADQDSKITITIGGTIIGFGAEFEQLANQESDGAANTFNEDVAVKYANALGVWSGLKPYLYQLAKSYLPAGMTVRPIPDSKTEGRQPLAGTITYSHSYTAFSSEDGLLLACIPNSTDESFNISDNYPGQVYAMQAVIGRKVGPVLQDIGTQTVWKRTISIGCKVDVASTSICKDYQGQKTDFDTSSECLDFDSAVASEKRYWVANPNRSTSCFGNFNSIKPSMNEIITEPDSGSQRQAIRELVDNAKPVGAVAIYTDAPSESWNPATGDWSYNVGWTYEITPSYICNENVDGISGGDFNYPGTTSPG